jgi:hypothetical protein
LEKEPKRPRRSTKAKRLIKAKKVVEVNLTLSLEKLMEKGQKGQDG